MSIGIKLRSLVLQCYGWNGLLCPDYASERKSVWHSWGERGMSRMSVCTYAWWGWCTVQLSWGIYFPILLLNLSINWIPRLYRVWPPALPLFSFLLLWHFIFILLTNMITSSQVGAKGDQLVADSCNLVLKKVCTSFFLCSKSHGSAI